MVGIAGYFGVKDELLLNKMADALKYTDDLQK